MTISYMLASLNGSTNIVECGTSFGLCTIYLALATKENASNGSKGAFGVLTLEKDPGKVERAKEIWREAGSAVEDWIDCRQGDLLMSLQNGQTLPSVVDLLFLDGKC